MAGRKEYEMLFMLNAALNGNFQGTFSKAQQEFSKLGKEVQDLQKLQANVSSYQKQEQAVASTTAKLDNLRQQEALLEQQITATRNAEEQDTAAIAALEREKLKLEQRIANTETALERQNQKLDTTGQKLQQAGVDTANLAQEDARLTEKIKELQAQQDKAANSAASFGERAVQGFEAVQSAIVAAGIADKLSEIGDAYLECVTVAANFEESMSTVEALSGSAAQEMAELTATAKELGATTKFTAQQSADAMGFMAMAGWDAQQMMAGMDGVINLAAASGEDLANVSDIVTDNLTAFGLAAEDTAHFSDVLAAAATNSNTSVGIMGETFKQSAAVAGALGFSIEDVAVGVGLMANAGVKGSIAGTALKNTFNGLLEGATLTSAAFGDYEFTAIRADGTMKSFSNTIDELRVYFDQTTEAERVNNAMAIAGQRGYNGLLAILNATDADYQSLTNSINNCSGAAKRMADIKLDNLNGQLTLMNSAWEAVQTTIGEQFNPELRRLAEFGTAALGWVNDFIQDHPALVKGIMAAVGALGAGVTALTGVAAVTKVLIPLMGTLTAAVPGVNVIMGVAATVAGVSAVVTGLTTAMDNGIPSVKELTEATRDMSAAMDEAGVTYEQTANKALATAEVADTYIGKLEEIEAATNGNVSGNQEYQNVLALLLRTMPELSDSISQTTDEYGRSVYTLETSAQALRENTAEWKKNAQAQAYQEYINTLYDQYGSVMLEAAENSVKLTQAQVQLENLEKAREADLARLNELESKGVALTGEEQAEYYQLQNALLGYNSEMLNAADAVKTYTEAVEKDNETLAAAEAEIENAENTVRDLTGAIEDQADTLPELDSALLTVQEQMMNLAECYDNAYQDAYASIDGQIGLFEKMSVEVDNSISDMISSLDSQISYMATYSENLRKAAEMGLSEGLLAQLSDGSTQSAAYLQAIVDDGGKKIEELNAAFAQVQEGKEAFSDTVAEIQIGLDEALAEMEQSVQDGVEKMELPDEAAESARETIQAFIDQADKMRPWVRDAFAELGQTAVNSLGLNLNAAGKASTKGSSYNYFDIPGHAGNVENGFAAGTSNAPPGWAWVGEEGPELIRMQGGETVLPAEVSREFALLTTYQNEVAAYAGGTDDASAVMEEVAKLTEISNAAYTTYDNAVYNSASYLANTSEAIPTAIEVIPSPGGGTDSISTVMKETEKLTEISNAVTSFAVPEVIISPTELQAAAEAARLTEISNAAYADYDEAVYNNAAYNTVNRADYTAYANPPAVSTSVPEVAEAVLSAGYGGGSTAPIKVEVHIHIEGNAAPETVQALEDYVRRGELQEAVADAMENIQADARRGAYV